MDRTFSGSEVILRRPRCRKLRQGDDCQPLVILLADIAEGLGEVSLTCRRSD